MLKKLRNFFAPKLETLNRVKLNQAALIGNYRYLQSLASGTNIIPVLKSNAYGHGLREVCQILVTVKPTMVAVDSYPEYQIAKKELKSDILIMGETHLSVYKQFDPKRTVLAVYNISTLQHLISLGKKFRIHIFLNTGMNREGIQQENLEEFCNLCKNSNIQLEWVMSHLAYGDNEKMELITAQYDRFKIMHEIILSHGLSPTRRHINNSGWFLQGKDEFFTAHRIGLALYGYNPLSETNLNYEKGNPLQPVMSVRSTVIGIQHVYKDDHVGYDGTYKITSNKSTIATIPFGYTEWLRRGASKLWNVSIGETQLPSAGRISMNLSSRVAPNTIHIWDKVCVISNNPQSLNNFSTLASCCDTIVYEVLVGIASNIRRKII